MHDREHVVQVTDRDEIVELLRPAQIVHRRRVPFDRKERRVGVATRRRQVLTYIGTAFWWGPGQGRLHQARLADGSLDPSYDQLVATNWIRVALLSVAGLLELWIAIKSFVLAPNSTWQVRA